jgi:hypothetical protein
MTLEDVGPDNWRPISPRAVGETAAGIAFQRPGRCGADNQCGGIEVPLPRSQVAALTGDRVSEVAPQGARAAGKGPLGHERQQVGDSPNVGVLAGEHVHPSVLQQGEHFRC